MYRRVQQRLTRVVAALVLSLFLAGAASAAILDYDPDPNYKPNGGTGDGPPPGDGEGGDADEILIRARPGQEPLHPGIDADVDRDRGTLNDRGALNSPSWLERILARIRGSF